MSWGRGNRRNRASRAIASTETFWLAASMREICAASTWQSPASVETPMFARSRKSRVCSAIPHASSA